MIAIHDQFTRQLRNRLKATGMGLGVVRLLQDAKRFEEARTILYLLENGRGVEADILMPAEIEGGNRHRR
jgi:hypothetical protein